MAIALDKYPKHWSERGKEVLLSYEKACEFLDYLYEEYEGYVAFDTETENLNRRYNNKLVSLQFAINDKKGYVLIIDKPYTTFSEKQLKVIRKKLKKLFESDKKNIIWIMHNAQFDLSQVLTQLGVKWVYNTVYDTQLFIHLLDENLIVKKHDYSRLKDKAAEYFNFTLYEKEAIDARGEGNLLALPKDKFVTYAGMDAYVTYRLFMYLKAYAKEIGYWSKACKLLKYVYSPALKSFCKISLNGFYIDKKQLQWLLSSKSPILGRLEEIKQYYYNNPIVKAVNKELSMSDNLGVSSPFGFKTKWVFDMNKPKHREALFFTSKKGLQLKNDDGSHHSDETFQAKYRDSVELVRIFSEEQELKKQESSYMKPIFNMLSQTGKTDLVDGRIRPTFLLNGTVTGRISSCIRKGTYIEVVRDTIKHPKGIKIEDVNPGDLVYCYDKNCKPTIKKVLDKIYKGKKELLRIHWIGSGRQFSGYLDCTPDHKIRLTTGEYIRADKLKAGDSVLALTHKGDRLWFTGNYDLCDHRFVYDKCVGKISANNVIHHIDGNHYNNIPDNLEQMSLEEHTGLHSEGRIVSKRERILTSKRMKNIWKDENYRESHSGINSAVYKRYSRNELLRLMDETGGRPTLIVKNEKCDYGWLMQNFVEAGLNWRNIAFFYNSTGEKLTKNKIKKALQENINTELTSKKLRIGSRKLKELCSYYGINYGIKSKKSYQELQKVVKERRDINLKENNHNIVKVEKLNIEDDVYDLVIQGTHNFIANGICVHNCNPNLQQIPRSDTYEKKQIKCMYAAEPNKKRCLLQADFCANEIRFWGLVSEDHNLCKAFNDSFKKGQEFRDNPTDEKLAEEAHLLGDIHKQTAAMMFDIDVRKVDKGLRQQSKGLSLGIMYQRGTYSVAQQMGVKFEEAQEKVDKFNAKFPEGVQWAEEMKKYVLKHGYVESPIGRRRHLNEDIAKGKALVEKSKEYPRNSAKGKELFKKGNGFIARAQRQSVNSPIQGVANDVAMVSSAMLNEYIATNNLDWLIVNTVHDSVVVELPQDDLMLAAKVIRNLFTKKNKEYFEKHFPNWKWKTHVDIDFEVSQGRAKICKKCGKTYMFGLKKCECGCEDYKVKELNHGYGTIVPFGETKHDLKLVRKGF